MSVAGAQCRELRNVDRFLPKILFFSFRCRKQNGARLHGCAHRFKFETARFAEWLERISGPFLNEFTHFVDRKIGREVLFGDEAQRGFSLRQDRVRGAKANAVQQSIGVQQRLRFFQRALERVNDPCRAFADELAVKSFAPPDLGAEQFPFAKGSLRDPGSRHRGGPPTSDPSTPAIAVTIAVSISYQG